MIYSTLRKRWLSYTEEENVRQNLVLYLIEQKSYPPSMMREEKQFRIQHQQRRVDLLVYRPNMKVFLLVECKAPQIAIDERSIQQGLSYYGFLQADYMAFTNGKACHVLVRKENALVLEKEFPTWPQQI